MSALSDIEAAAVATVPQARAAKIALVCFSAVLLIAGIAGLYWLVFVRPHQAQVAAKTAKVEAATSNATAGASQDAVRIVTVHDKEVERINTITQGGSYAVQSAVDAGTPVPGVAAALRGSVCLFDTYRGDPGCPAVPGSGEVVGAAQPDARSAAAGR